MALYVFVVCFITLLTFLIALYSVATFMCNGTITRIEGTFISHMISYFFYCGCCNEDFCMQSFWEETF